MMFIKNFSLNLILRRLANLQFAIGMLLFIGILIAIGTFIEQDQSIVFYQTNYPESQPILGICSFLAIEVTFFDNRVSVKNARAHGHIHIDELVEKSKLLKNNHILIMHLSARHTAEEALRIIESKLPKQLLDRITILPNLSPFKALEQKMNEL